MLSTLTVRNQNLDIEDSLQLIQNILPDVPTYIDQNKTLITFCYRSSFIGTYLLIKIGSPKLSEESDPKEGTDNFGFV